MADWIHLDKTSGTGPAEVRVTADINETGDTSGYVQGYKRRHQGGEDVRVQAGVGPGGYYPGVRLPSA